LSEHVADADALVIEATFLDRDSAMARDYGHLTATKAAELAATSNVKQLVLTHSSGRYPDEEILAEATDLPEQPGCRRLRSHRDLRTLLKDGESPFGKARRPLDDGRVGDRYTARRSGVNPPRFKVAA
jgi:hypothetical protein